MKTIKYIFSLALVFFISCAEDDNNLSFVDEVAAPTNVSALFQITQDNTGTVTIIPNSEGAVSYNISLGDDTTEPVVIESGENIVHTYNEGAYTIGIEAVGLTGLTTSITQELVVSFNAPENLMVTIENDAAISKQVNVTSTADYAVSYNVYFGEPGNDDPVTANIGEVASYNYQDAGTYTIRVVAMSAAIETTEYTEEFEVTAILQPLAGAPTPYRSQNNVVSIYSDAYSSPDPIDFYPNWGQTTTFAPLDINGNNFIQYGGLTYQGIDFNTAPVDASEMEFLHIDVWTADDNFSAKLSPISSGPNETAYDLTLTANQWTSFDIPLSDFTDQNPLVDFSNIIQFKFDGVPSGEGTIFIDNLYFYKEPAQGGPLVFDDFEGNGNITTWAGDAAGMDNNFANPFVDANNDSATVLEYNDTGGQYANVRFDTASNFDLTGGNSTFTLKIYVPSSSISGTQPNQISLKLQDGTAAEPWVLQTEIVKPLTLDTWQELTFDFANDVTAGQPDPISRTDFNRVVLQVNSEGNSDTVIAYIDDISYGVSGDTAPFATDDFEGNGTITTWAGDAAGMDNNFANPFVDANNGSATVLEYNDTGGQYANIRFDVSPNFDLQAKSKFTLKIYVPSSSISGTQSNQISLKLQDGTAAEPWVLQTEIIKTITLDTWQEITFDFANDTTAGQPDPISRTDFNRVVLQVNSEGNNDTVIAYIDDFNYHN
ncbi:hypothetical protein SAMN05428642_102385 [Flaviramulus basaltis]|uniref:PKD domain-containing protein n=1 Tax=Flaviramulus basaltis TaxID=369401 RepID=A0A1K2IHC5_9FLAO|nr:hypothetical protein [Flaviramulus basaltis]SFZ91845.1 hypothetical protein SAMN05428642_102385 [Flaviramulus basaltis]